MQVIIGRDYPDIITKLVSQAEHSIKILIYDWRWYSSEPGSRIQKFNNEVLKAKRRGVDVFALVNSDCISRPLAEQNIKVKKINSSKVMHVKMVIIDEKFLIIGSHNLTKNAFDLNHEISVLVDDEPSIIQCVAFFNSMAL